MSVMPRGTIPPGAVGVGGTLHIRVTRPATPRGVRAALLRLLNHRLARVGYAGGASALVDFGVFNLLLLALDRERTFDVLIANSGAFACAMVVNYSLNSRITFGVRPTRRSLIAYVVFTAFGLVFYNFNLLWIRGLFDAVSPLALNASKVAAMGLLVIWNYFGYERFVFGPDARESARIHSRSETR